MQYIVTTTDEAQAVLEHSWKSGAERALSEVIKQCDDLLSSDVLRDPLAVKVIRDWCETVKLEVMI